MQQGSCTSSTMKLTVRRFLAGQDETYNVFYLFVLRLNVPVNNFSVMSGRSHRFLGSWVINQYFRGVKCLAQGHHTAAVGIEPPTSRSGVRHSTTEPPRSPMSFMPQSTHILFLSFYYDSFFPNDAFFKQKHLRVISENTFRRELVLFSHNYSRIWQSFAVH